MFNEFIDLTHTLKNGIPYFRTEWHNPFEIKQLGYISEVGRETKLITIGTHTGTHMDAQRHFIEHGNTIENIPLSTLCGKVSIVDFSYLQENEPITVNMLKEKKITERTIFYFNWNQYWDNAEKFYKNYPYFTIEAAEYLVETGIKLVGMDTPSPDDSRIKLLSENDSVIHKIFLKNNIVIVEYLNNLSAAISKDDWNLIALPLKIQEGDGSPSRVILTR